VKSLVIVPVYNEEPYLTRVIDKIRQYHSDILVVDDGSSDCTPQILRHLRSKFGVQFMCHRRNLGYGRTLIDGFNYSIQHGYDAVVTIDADDQHEPRYITQLLAALPGWDIVSCSRYMPGGQVVGQVPPERRRVNAEVTAIINCVTGYRLTDTFCGLKAYAVSALRKLNLTEPGYGMPLQMWIQAARASLRVKEVPVCVKYVDPNRTFGAELDVAKKRLEYYRRVIRYELAKITVGQRRKEFCRTCCGMCDA